MVFVGDDSPSGSGGGATSSTIAGSGGAACDPASHTIDVADYDTTCTEALDCAPAFFGDLCGPCSCAFGAINLADQARYSADVQLLNVGTPPDSCFCPATVVDCDAGRCVGGTP